MLEENSEFGLSIREQTELLGIARTGFYYKPIIKDDSELANLIRDAYQDSDCRYGYRKIVASLKIQGKIVNNKKVLKIMRAIGLKGLTPRRSINTSVKDKKNKIYPYLLTGLAITHPNQVWATDITYIKLRSGFMYFTAIIDLYSRYIVASNLSHSMEVSLCIEPLIEALAIETPEIFNTDQGSQFTSKDFIGTLEPRNIKISMDHKGRCFDNIFVERLWRTVKQEAVYFYRPETIPELEKCLNNFVGWYNDKRLHQSLNYKTPAFVYHNEKKK